MKKVFNFERLINKYSVDCQLLMGAAGGNYAGGNWVPDAVPEPKELSGAILPMTERKLYQSGGTYTESDRVLLTFQEIPLEGKVFVVYKGRRYEVQENTDYSDYADFYSYNLKRVNVFDRTKKR